MCLSSRRAVLDVVLELWKDNVHVLLSLCLCIAFLVSWIGLFILVPQFPEWIEFLLIQKNFLLVWQFLMILDYTCSKVPHVSFFFWINANVSASKKASGNTGRTKLQPPAVDGVSVASLNDNSINDFEVRPSLHSVNIWEN